MDIKTGGTADLQPTGTALREALRWISAERQARPQTRLLRLIEEAAFRYDLSPRDEEFLLQALAKRE